MAEGMKDKVTGKAKGVAGEVSGDNELKAEGRADQAAGKIKDFAEKAMDKAEEASESVKAGVDKIRKELK